MPILIGPLEAAGALPSAAQAALPSIATQVATPRKLPFNVRTFLAYWFAPGER